MMQFDDDERAVAFVMEHSNAPETVVRQALEAQDTYGTALGIFPTLDDDPRDLAGVRRAHPMLFPVEYLQKRMLTFDNEAEFVRRSCGLTPLVVVAILGAAMKYQCFRMEIVGAEMVEHYEEWARTWAARKGPELS